MTARLEGREQPASDCPSASPSEGRPANPLPRPRQLAGLIGPILIAIAASEAFNPHIWTTNIPAITYLNGTLLLVAGLAIVRAHNRWSRGWPVAITLVGWSLIAAGLYRMFAPDAPQATRGTATGVLLIALFALGVFLSARAYAVPRLLGVPLLAVASVLLVRVLFVPILVPRTVEFDTSLPYTDIGGYKYHTEVFGDRNAPPVIVVHGGPGQGYEYMKALKNLSNEYRVIFYDQRGAGLSPRVDKTELTLEQSLDDLQSIIDHFSGGQQVKLIGHSWGGMLVVGYLTRHPEKVSQAVIIEPTFLYPGAPVEEWATKFTREMLSFWDIARYVPNYPFVLKEDGQEGFDYVATKMANESRPGPPYNCRDQKTPPNTFQRLGYAAYDAIFQPIIDHPESFTSDLTDGIAAYHGGLMLISTECSILGHEFQERYNLPRLPPQTMHVKAAGTGHNVLTFQPDWSVQAIAAFFTP